MVVQYWFYSTLNPILLKPLHTFNTAPRLALKYLTSVPGRCECGVLAQAR